MRRLACVLLGCFAIAGCGGEEEPDVVRVLSPPSFEAVARDMADDFIAQDRGQAEVVVGEGESAAEGADIVMTDSEGAMVALAERGVVRSESWNIITSRGSTDIFVAIASEAPNPDGALQWVSYASGAFPWSIYEAHGYEGA